MEFNLMLLGFFILIGFAAHLAYKRTKIPGVLFLIVGGILAGPVLGIVKPEYVLQYAPLITALMLIFVMLDNGLSFDIYKLFHALPAVSVFTVGMIIMNAAAITLILHLFLSMSLLAAAILGFAMAGTSTDLITSLVKRMNIHAKAKQSLIIESVLNDVQMIPFFVLLEMAITSSFNIDYTVNMLMITLPFSAILGILLAFLWVFILGRFLGENPLNYIATIGILFLVYGFVEFSGGTGAITIFCFSLILGNAVSLFRKLHVNRRLRKKFSKNILRNIREVEIDMSFLVEVIFFVFLGIAFSFRVLEPRYLMMSFVILVAILICRYVGVRLLAKKLPEIRNSIGPMTWIMPRGYIAAVLAFAALGSGVFGHEAVDIVLMNIFLTTFVSIAYSIYHEKTFRIKRK